MIKLYGSPNTNTGRCIWCLEEAGLKYKNVPISLKDLENRSEDFLKLNPNGKIPVLVDGDVTLWESMSINFYIGDHYKQDLIGALVKDRAFIRQWSFWASMELFPFVSDFTRHTTVFPESHRRPELAERAKKRITNSLEVLEQTLKAKPYLVANRFTLADLNVSSCLVEAQSAGQSYDDFPKIKAWLTTLSSRPAFQVWQKLTQDSPPVFG